MQNIREVKYRTYFDPQKRKPYYKMGGKKIYLTLNLLGKKFFKKKKRRAGRRQYTKKEQQEKPLIQHLTDYRMQLQKRKYFEDQMQMLQKRYDQKVQQGDQSGTAKYSGLISRLQKAHKEDQPEELKRILNDMSLSIQKIQLEQSRIMDNSQINDDQNINESQMILKGKQKKSVDKSEILNNSDIRQKSNIKKEEELQQINEEQKEDIIEEQKEDIQDIIEQEEEKKDIFQESTEQAQQIQQQIQNIQDDMQERIKEYIQQQNEEGPKYSPYRVIRDEPKEEIKEDVQQLPSFSDQLAFDAAQQIQQVFQQEKQSTIQGLSAIQQEQQEQQKQQKQQKQPDQRIKKLRDNVQKYNFQSNLYNELLQELPQGVEGGEQYDQVMQLYNEQAQLYGEIEQMKQQLKDEGLLKKKGDGDDESKSTNGLTLQEVLTVTQLYLQNTDYTYSLQVITEDDQKIQYNNEYDLNIVIFFMRKNQKRTYHFSTLIINNVVNPEEIVFFDPLGQKKSFIYPIVAKQLQKVSVQINQDEKIKFKYNYNQIQDTDEKEGDNSFDVDTQNSCGQFTLLFIQDYIKDFNFKEASQFNQLSEQQKEQMQILNPFLHLEKRGDKQMRKFDYV